MSIGNWLKGINGFAVAVEGVWQNANLVFIFADAVFYVVLQESQCVGSSCSEVAGETSGIRRLWRLDAMVQEGRVQVESA